MKILNMVIPIILYVCSFVTNWSVASQILTSSSPMGVEHVFCDVILRHCIKIVVACSRVAQSVTCLATDACLTADPGVASSIPARYHTFVEIDYEIISTVILLPSADLFKKGCCQLQAKVCAQITG